MTVAAITWLGDLAWFQAEGYDAARWLVQRGVAAVFAIAFANVLAQWPALLGDEGLTPARRVAERGSSKGMPSIFRWRYSDRLVTVVALVGLVTSLTLLMGLPQAGPPWAPMLLFLLLWALYLSLVEIGQTWYAFGWETILLEAGFYAALLGSDAIAPPWLTILMLRWLVFRIEFGAGLIKMRGDPCWRDLTCLEYHHETQPLPSLFSWYFHHLPKPLHRVEVGANHFAQLIAPIGLFLPQPVAGIAGAVIVVTQGYLIISGNFSWLNAITVVLATAALPDAWLGWLPVPETSAAAEPGLWFVAVVLAVAVLTVVLSQAPVRNMASKYQAMNTSFNRFRLVGSYGAFGSITRTRYELVVEGTTDPDPGPGSDWQAYGFKGKPTHLDRRPRQIAPWHLRLDWLMWFAAMSPSPGRWSGWFLPFVVKLLQADERVLGLLREDPFDGARPTAVRVRRFRYRFSTRSERRETGQWWVREDPLPYLGPVTLGADGLRRV